MSIGPLHMPLPVSVHQNNNSYSNEELFPSDTSSVAAKLKYLMNLSQNAELARSTEDQEDSPSFGSLSLNRKPHSRVKTPSKSKVHRISFISTSSDPALVKVMAPRNEEEEEDKENLSRCSSDEPYFNPFKGRWNVVNCFKVVPRNALVSQKQPVQGFTVDATPDERSDILRKSAEHQRNLQQQVEFKLDGLGGAVKAINRRGIPQRPPPPTPSTDSSKESTYEKRSNDGSRRKKKGDKKHSNSAKSSPFSSLTRHRDRSVGEKSSSTTEILDEIWGEPEPTKLQGANKLQTTIPSVLKHWPSFKDLVKTTAHSIGSAIDIRHIVHPPTLTPVPHERTHQEQTELDEEFDEIKDLIPKSKKRGIYSTSDKKKIEVRKASKKWRARGLEPLETKYISTIFEVMGSGLGDCSTDLIDELHMWAEYGDVVCCEMVWSTPRKYRDLGLEHELREAINRRMVTSKWDVCEALSLDTVPRSQIEEANKKNNDGKSYMGLYRHYSLEMMGLGHLDSKEQHSNTWVFTPTQTPFNELCEYYSEEQLNENSMAMINFVCIKLDYDEE